MLAAKGFTVPCHASMQQKLRPFVKRQRVSSRGQNENQAKKREHAVITRTFATTTTDQQTFFSWLLETPNGLNI